MLQIDNLVFSYHKKKNPIFDGINLSIQPGAVYGLLGKNGIGKSTLLYMMSGLMFPHKGSIRLDGVEVKRRLPETLEKIFLVPEEFDLPAISVDAYVRRNSVFYPHFSRDQFNRYLTDFELEGTSNLAKTSMGQKKKYLVSFALATNTPLLLMDEPTNGMDIPSKSQFRKVIASGMTDEKTIIISTHQVRDIDRLLDHITIIDGTEVLLDKSVKEITDRLYFCEQSMNEPTDGALFIQPSVQGNSIIMENKFGEESPMNLEVLFNAILAERNKIQEVFNK